MTSAATLANVALTLTPLPLRLLPCVDFGLALDCVGRGRDLGRRGHTLGRPSLWLWSLLRHFVDAGRDLGRHGRNLDGEPDRRRGDLTR